jgi:hypothetical protein
MEKMNRLTYRPEPVAADVREAAGYAASQCGYDQFEEILLNHEIVDVRRVSAESVRALYADWLQPPCSFSPDEIMRVDWLTWAIPKRFNGEYEAAVIARAESIVVAATTLLAREVFTYGLGPEYNWLEWEEGRPPSNELPASVFGALRELISGDWRNDVREHADDDASYLDQIHPKLQGAVAKVIGNKRPQT